MESTDTFVFTDEYARMQTYGAIRDMGIVNGISALLLDGPPGTGKTFLGRTAAKHLGGRYIAMQAFPGMGRKDLLFDDEQHSNGEKYGDGVLLQAIKASQSGRVVLHFDEWDKADVSIDSFLLNFLSEAVLYHPVTGLLEANRANMLVVITKNDQREVTPPLMRRCRCVYVEWPTVPMETIILKRAIPWMTPAIAEILLDVPNKLRRNPEVLKAPAVSEIIRLASDLADQQMRSATPQTIGDYFVKSIAPYPQDRRFISSSALYLGTKLKEAFEGLPAVTGNTEGVSRGVKFLEATD